ADVVSDAGVPEDLVEEVSALLCCPSCGSQVEGWGEVGIQWSFEAEFEAALKKASRRWDAKLASFGGFLERYPTLGATQAVGKRILREIDKFPKSRLPQQTWHRARRVDGGRKFSAEELGVPDPATTGIAVGRFNHPGQAHWYLAEDPHTALSEVLRDPEK